MICNNNTTKHKPSYNFFLSNLPNALSASNALMRFNKSGIMSFDLSHRSIIPKKEITSIISSSSKTYENKVKKQEKNTLASIISHECQHVVIWNKISVHFRQTYIVQVKHFNYNL